MTPSEITCRLCGKHFGRPDGCATCEPAKANIIWPALASEDMSLLRVAHQSVRLLQLNLDRLEAEMTESLGGRTGHYHDEHAKQSIALGKGVAQVLAETRKLEERDAKRVAQMSFAEKVELYMDFLDGLPQEYQKQVVERMAMLLEGDIEADVES